MASEIVVTLTGLFCSLVSSIITFFLTRRKYNTEVDSYQIKNMSDSFDLYKKMSEETVNSLNGKLDLLQKENSDLRQQVSQLQMQMINILGSICLDSTCRLRKMNFQSDLKFSDNGIHLGDDK